jgi:DNA replication licensing factor MCM4
MSQDGDLSQVSSPLDYGSIGSFSDVRDNPILSRVDIGGPELAIWGTNVVVTSCKDVFKKFIMNFNSEKEERFYIKRINDAIVLEETFVDVDCEHIRLNTTLYADLVRYPQEVIPIFDQALNEILFDRGSSLGYRLQIRPFFLKHTRKIRLLKCTDIDQLISISGMVIRVQNNIPFISEPFFKCIVCSFTVSTEGSKIIAPNVCENCNINSCFQFIYVRSKYINKQIVKLQESYDDISAGHTACTILMYVYNDLVDKVQAGDFITVTGIYRAIPIKQNNRTRVVSAVYQTHLDVINISKKKLSENVISPEKIEELVTLAQMPDVYDILARAIAPSIYENIDIKKGILLQLFGGTKKNHSAGGRRGFRSNIHILLCGDPGTSKSQLLKYVFHLIPRSQYTAGKGASAVGLTGILKF